MEGRLQPGLLQPKPKGVKWSPEEVDALQRAIAKHGTRWKLIKEDPEFSKELWRPKESLSSKWLTIDPTKQSPDGAPASKKRKDGPHTNKKETNKKVKKSVLPAELLAKAFDAAPTLSELSVQNEDEEKDEASTAEMAANIVAQLMEENKEQERGEPSSRDMEGNFEKISAGLGSGFEQDFTQELRTDPEQPSTEEVAQETAERAPDTDAQQLNGDRPKGLQETAPSEMQSGRLETAQDGPPESVGPLDQSTAERQNGFAEAMRDDEHIDNAPDDRPERQQLDLNASESQPGEDNRASEAQQLHLHTPEIQPGKENRAAEGQQLHLDTSVLQPREENRAAEAQQQPVNMSDLQPGEENRAAEGQQLPVNTSETQPGEENRASEAQQFDLNAPEIQPVEGMEELHVFMEEELAQQPAVPEENAVLAQTRAQIQDVERKARVLESKKEAWMRAFEKKRGQYEARMLDVEAVCRQREKAQEEQRQVVYQEKWALEAARQTAAQLVQELLTRVPAPDNISLDKLHPSMSWEETFGPQCSIRRQIIEQALDKKQKTLGDFKAAVLDAHRKRLTVSKKLGLDVRDEELTEEALQQLPECKAFNQRLHEMKRQMEAEVQELDAKEVAAKNAWVAFQEKGESVREAEAKLKALLKEGQLKKLRGKQAARKTL